MSLAIFVSDDRDRPQLPGHLDQRVAGALRGEVVGRLDQRQVHVLGQALDDVAGEGLRRVDAGADRGAAERQPARPAAACRRCARCPRRSARRSRRTPGRGSPAWRPSGGSGRTSRPCANRAAGLPQARARGARARAASCVDDERTTARWMADGNTSLDDCDALTWSFGWTGEPSRSVASEAITSFMFMFDDVPEPVWNTSIGNWSSWTAHGHLGRGVVDRASPCPSGSP